MAALSSHGLPGDRRLNAARASQLPAPWTSFVGREYELFEVRRLLHKGARLVTLTGTGGVGKTRLAMHVIHDLGEAWPDGVRIVELAALDDEALVPQVIAASVGVREQPGQAVLETLAERLQARQLLLVLDNCEHVHAACAKATFALLRACPGLAILATSRERLDVPGEVTWRVPSLVVSDAVQMFVARARAVVPSFAPTDANVTTITQICKQLDGIPLAIELAAARVNALTPAEIAARLDDRFRLLTGGSHLAVPRQQTLRAAVDWSYALLSEQERAIFARLSPFAGGFTLEAAAYLCDQADILDHLARLVDKSLVQMDQEGPASRYRLLETLRDYAHERLEQSGTAEHVRKRHAEFFLDLAQRIEPDLRGSEQHTWVARLEREHDNFRTALRWSIAHGEATTALLLSGALGYFWTVRGHRHEGLRWLDAALAMGNEGTPKARAKATSWAGYLAAEVSEADRARRLFEESLRLRAELSDTRGAARVLEQYGDLERRCGRYERAAELLEHSLRLRRELDDRHGIASTLGSLGRLAWSTRDFARAEAQLDQAMRLFQELGDLHDAAHERAFLGQVAAGLGRLQRSADLHQRALEFFRSIGDADGMAASLNQLAWLAVLRQRPDARAAQMCREAMALFHDLGAQWGMAMVLETAALLVGSQARPASAVVVRIFAAADALREAIDLPLPPATRPARDSALASARSALSADDAEAAWRAGRELSVEEAGLLAGELLDGVVFAEDEPPAAARSHNLPAQVSRFVGRGHDIEEVKRLQADGRRVLTLTGAGGMGKTRLALRVAEDLVPAYSGGVWLVELGTLEDPALVSHAVAAAIGVREREDATLEDTLERALRSASVLLVVDNCEHVLRACGDLITRLVRACPRLHVLVTSRQALGLADETVWRVQPLLVPLPAATQGSDEIAASEAVQLFVDRARAVVPSFRLTDTNATAIAQICRQLDGIPLAIELAAARVEALGVRQIAERLDDSLGLLTRGNRAAQQRHQTLRGALDWSFSLLAESERVLFGRLSVFGSGWTLEAAEAICGPVGVLDSLAELVSRSLVVASGHDTEARYSLLEVVRQYAAELLRASGEEETIRGRHLAWYLQLAERSAVELRGPAQTDWLHIVEREHGNLRAAVRWCLESGMSEAALQLIGASAYFCQIRGHLYRTESRVILEQALARTADLPLPASAARARALYWAGTFAGEQFDYARAMLALEESLRLWRALEDDGEIAEVLIVLAGFARVRGDYDRAEALLTEAIGLARARSGSTSLARALRYQGAIARERGDAQRARQLNRESIELFRAGGESHQIGHVLDQLAEALRDLGDHEAAQRAHQDSMPLLSAAGCEEGVNSAIYHQARLAQARGDALDALALGCESLRVYERYGVRRDVAGCLDLVAELCAEHEPDRAARLLAAAANVRRTLDMHLAPADHTAWDAAMLTIRSRLSTGDFEREWSAGESMPLGQAVDEALTLQLPTSLVQLSARDLTAAEADPLSTREREVALLIAEGLTNRAIADRLVIAPRTAEAHVTHVLNKLGLRSRSQVAVWVVSQDQRSQQS